MFKYEVSSSHPLPRKKSAMPPRQSKYPYAIMKMGQSFFIPAEEAEGSVPRLLKRMTASNHAMGKKLSRKFIARGVENGVRVWRSA